MPEEPRRNLASSARVACAIIYLLATLILPFAARAQGEPAKRVLIVHSFGCAAPPFTVHARAFESELVGKLGARVDLDEVMLDMARYAAPDMQDAIVEYLEKRQLKWKPDLVVPIGSPAGVFVSKYRDRLFPGTPILYSALDRRLLPPEALEKNAAYIGQIFEIPGLIDDMMKVAPATKNIAVVVGVTPLEQYWKQAFQNAAAPLSDKINFTYLDDLPFDQVLEKARTLPPNSYIFVLLLLRDAGGVTHNADEALQRLHAVANAPINSIFDHQLGLGIVGGRLYQSEQVGRDAAAMALRILRGEAASSFEPKLLHPLPPRYDWRELQRWKIDEKRLARDSTILYRTPTAWQEYREWIIFGASVFVAQALLISALLANLV
ncbi:MAG: ABC transporter substrate-binding protein, partial [Chthoniobacterales bacterium]